MRIVVVLAVAALVALIVALISGSTLAAIVVVMLALAGIVLLLRDWRAERTATAAPEAEAAESSPGAGEPLTPDEFSPDITGSDHF